MDSAIQPQTQGSVAFIVLKELADQRATVVVLDAEPSVARSCLEHEANLGIRVDVPAPLLES